jgi:uncharacterized protein
VTLPVQVLVLAKSPVPGRVKTRLCPPLSPVEAADVAAAALADTLDAVRAAAVARRVLALDGTLDAPGFDVQAQRGRSFDARLGAALDDAAATSPLPVLVVGMDTPQLDATGIEAAARALLTADAALGLAEDGGWWCLGLRRPRASLVLGIPASRDDTGARQAARLRGAGLSVARLPVLRDVDTCDDAVAVAALAPSGRFADVVSRLLVAA